MKEVGKAIQYPMKLGFAITVHKAQGQTYDEMNLVPEIFQDGQLYVALSRCKFARNLYISDPLNSRMVRASQEVVNYYKNPENYTFFGKEQDIISVQTSRECEGAVKLLSRVYKNHKSEVIDFLSALEKLDESTKNNKDSKTKEEPKDVSEEYLPLEELKFLTKESQRVEEVEQLSFGFEETTKPAPIKAERLTTTWKTKKKRRCDKKNNLDIIVFDTETTGFSSANDRIIEIGAVMIRGGRIVDKFDTFVNPHKKISKRITKLTGISNEMVKDAPDEEEANEIIELSVNRHHFKEITFTSSLTGKKYKGTTSDTGVLCIIDIETNEEVPNNSHPSKKSIVGQAIIDLGGKIDKDETLYQRYRKLTKMMNS